MDFLNMAIFPSAGEELSGVVLTKFNPHEFTSRATVSLATAEEFKEEYPKLEPMGFKFNEKGILYSDTQSRKVLTDDMFAYVASTYANMYSDAKDLIDVLLFGVVHDGWVLPDWEELGADCHCIKLNRYKVSNSSFNIYASYRVDDGSYRTHSMLNVEDGSPVKFYMALPTSANVDAFKAANLMEHIGPLNLDEVDMEVYLITTGVLGSPVCGGEAFLNYLAYNVAYYNIGEKVLRGLARSHGAAEAKPAPYSSQNIARVAKYNVSIEHEFKKVYLEDVQELVKNEAEFIEFVKTHPEAGITYHWLRNTYISKWYKEATARGKSESDAVLASCQNLLVSCQTTRLKFALELLSQRFYFYRVGYNGDPIGYHIKGGGVNGESVKRFTL